MTTIPDLPAGFTATFLTEQLHQHGCLPADGAVSNVSQSTIGDGTGMMAEIAKLHLHYDGDQGNAPDCLIAKFASQNPTNREIATAYNLYERETRFLAELDPMTEVRTPATYLSVREGDRFIILMEDLTDYDVGSQVIGATLEQSMLAIDQLVKLHAPFWGKVDSLDWVPHIANSYHADNMQSLASIGADGLMEKFGDYLTPLYRQHHAAFLERLPYLQAGMDTAPVTLCHGDYRMENLLYGNQPHHDAAAVIDWQGPLRARGMNDVALFLGQSTQIDVRRSHERALIDRYASGLKEAGIDAGDSIELWNEYRYSLLYNWVYVTVVAGTLDTSNETAFAWMAQMVARQSAVTEDLALFDQL